MSKPFLVLAACAAMLVPPVALRATVLAPAEFREVVTGSDIIAYGRVVETTAVSSDERTRVETLVTLRVGTYLKGAAGDTLVFSVPGGQVGRYRHVLVGAPRFAAGEEAVVFLKVRQDGQPVVFGLNQGVFRVRLDRTTKRRMVMPPPLLAHGDTPQAIVRGAPDRRPVAIETFGAQVQAVIAELPTREQR